MPSLYFEKKFLCSPASKLKLKRNLTYLPCSLQYQPASITSPFFISGVRPSTAAQIKYRIVFHWPDSSMDSGCCYFEEEYHQLILSTFTTSAFYNFKHIEFRQYCLLSLCKAAGKSFNTSW